MTECFSTRIMVLTCMLGCFLWNCLGCGIKAMPVAPGRRAPLAVSDLDALKTEDRVRLTWTMPQMEGNNAWTSVAVVVYRAAAAQKNGKCDHCPLKFEPIAQLPVSAPVAGEGIKMHHLDKPDAGYRYTYKVVPVNENDEKGQPSNLVEIQF